MTSQNSSFTQRYKPYTFDQVRQNDNSQWDCSSQTTPPIVPARGIKKALSTEPFNHSDETSWLAYEDMPNQTDDNDHEHPQQLRVQNNVYSNDPVTKEHDINVNHVHNNVFKSSTTSYTNMPWFHGKITREQAERALQPRTDGLFLVRESTNFPGDFTLCVCYQEKVEHYRVKSHDSKHTIDDEEFFDNLEMLIEHYKMDADGLCTQLVKPLSLCIISEKELEICESIGRGEFGEVMLGMWKSQKVAVKVLKDSSEAEAMLMKSLHHENLVNLLGIVRKEAQIYLVTEYMSKGSLVDYLRSRGRQHVTKKDQINFAFDTSCGMEYLEKMHVVHRDLAARNVLISESGMAKVSDFGLARDINAAASEAAKLPIKWTAPEALKFNRFSNKSDMWSFGILLWEIYSFGRVPYPRIPLTDVFRHVEKGYKMEAPEGCPTEVYEIMRQAWDLNLDHRPNFFAVKKKLYQLKLQTSS